MPAHQSLFRSLILLVCLVTLTLVVLRVIGHGYFPADDALRHIGKVISAKTWDDILVIRPEITLDSHPGWHTFLDGVRQITGFTPTNLLNFSVIFLFLLFMLPPCFTMDRPEAWVASLGIFAVFSTGVLYRLFYGRPYVLTMFVTVMFCFFWAKLGKQKTPWITLGAFAMLGCLSAWMHGAWYLLMLLPLSLALSRQWRAAGRLAPALAIGILAGASMTGHPLAFLHQMLFHALEAFGTHDFQYQLVTEFQSFSGDAMAVLVVAGLLLWRVSRGGWDRKCVDNPVFILGVIGWVFGFVAVRFWTDWGWPAIACWVAFEIQAFFKKGIRPHTLGRAGLAAVLCLVLFLALTGDRGSRWSSRTMAEWPQIDNIEQRAWLPDENGILYSDNMSVFYNIFFNNPKGPWRYILGFEPIWMPEEDLEIYRHIQLTRGKDESYGPWVEKMTAADRLVLTRMTKPEISGVDWHEVTPSVWSGRIIENE